MFRNFNKLILSRENSIKYSKNLNNIKSNEMRLNEILNKIPIAERWECRDFNVKNKKNYPVSSSDSYSLIVPNDKQYDMKKNEKNEN